MPAKKVPVVAINSKGEVIGYYESMREAGEMNGLAPVTISNAVRRKLWCKKHLWMKSEDYMVYWFEKRTDELRNSYKQSRKDAMRKRFETMGEEGRERWRKKHSENRKAYLKAHPDSIVRPRKKVLCITTGETFESASDFARRYGVHPSNACRSAREGGKVNGMELKYLE